MEKTFAKSIKKNSRKKILYPLISLAFIIALATLFSLDNDKNVLAAPNSTLYLDPATLTVNNDQTFSLEAKINPGTNQVSAIELHVNFDATRYNLTSITNSPVFSQVLQAAQMNNTNGTGSIILGVALTNPPTYVTTEQTVATFTFRATASSGTSGISFSDMTQAAALNESSNVIVSKNSSQITIGRQYGNADFSLLASDWLQTKTSQADVNVDGKIDARDLGIMMSNWGS